MDERDLTGAWDRSRLPSNIEVGPGCYLERMETFRHFRSERQPGLRIGANVKLYTWTEFSIEKNGAVEVGDDAVIVGAQIMCADRIVIGKGAVLSYNVVVADSDFHPLDPAARKLDAIANAPGGDQDARPGYESRPVLIGDGVLIGIGAMVLKGVSIGEGAEVLPGAVVTRDVGVGEVVGGNPARVVGSEGGHG